jgi:hypothetical protein
MDEERAPVGSRRFVRLAEKMRDKRYRDSYVASHTRQMLARQMRKFRGDQSQSEFAGVLDKRQTVVSRLENPSYSGWTLRTLFEVAQKLDVAVFVRFVDFPTFLKYSDDMSDAAMHPKDYDHSSVNNLSRGKESNALTKSAKHESGWTVISVTRGIDKPIVINTTDAPPPAPLIAASGLEPPQEITRRMAA